MRSHAIQHPHTSQPGAATIRRLDIAEPLDWLAAGARTFAQAPSCSLLYGTVFTLACWLVVALSWSLPWLTVAFLTGLMLVGPFLAAGLYVAARQQESGEHANIRGTLALMWERRTYLSLFALFLGLVAAAWVRLSSLLFALQFNGLSPSVEGFGNLLRGHFDPVLAGFFVGIGLLLAITVFITSALSIPMILDRDVDPVTAIQTSVRAVSLNRPAMAFWAALIVLLGGIGIMTAFVGMVVLFPVLGYATWHSYRRTVA